MTVAGKPAGGAVVMETTMNWGRVLGLTIALLSIGTAGWAETVYVQAKTGQCVPARNIARRRRGQRQIW
ncbi:MAG: hypothetical protein U0361_19085 [Nitrospiraceae bacterium]